VVEPWIRTPPSTAPTAAAYLTIVNRGRIADRLVSASSLLARAIQIHEMSMAGGMMRMRELSGGVAIGPGQTRQLAPAGEHLMMVNPTRAFHSGEKVPITLTFARAGRVTAEFEVRDAPPSVRLGSAGVKMR
jgi:copper(I)-binding protein